MTNYEKIQSMSIEGMAKRLCDKTDCRKCKLFDICGGYTRETSGYRKWLESEVVSMTHYEKIKHMSLAKMVDFLRNIRLSCEYGCDAQDLWHHNHYGKNCSMHCKQAISEWLESEVEKK